MTDHSVIGSEKECNLFSRNTDLGTDGWWYHAMPEETARAFASGEQRFRSDFDEPGRRNRWVSFARDPVQAAHHGGARLIRVQVDLQAARGDRFWIDDSAATRGAPWLHVEQGCVGRVMVEGDYLKFCLDV